MEHLTGFLGFFFLLGMAYALSSNRQAIRWQTVAWGIGLQVSLAWIVLKGELLSRGFAWLPFSLKTFVLGIIVQILFVRFLARRSMLASPVLVRRLHTIIAIETLVGLLKFNLVARFFVIMREAVDQLIAYSSEGARFVFGALGAEHGDHNVGFILAFQVLPTIIF